MSASPDNVARVLRLVGAAVDPEATAEAPAPSIAPAATDEASPPSTSAAPSDGFENVQDGGDRDGDDERVDEIVRECAGLDNSDTDNGLRLRRHFGDEMLVLAQEKARAPLWITWTGTHWDMATGGPRALAIGQRLGGRIALEVDHIHLTEAEQRVMDRAIEARQKSHEDLSEGDREFIGKAEKIRVRFAKKRDDRRKNAIAAKNAGKIRAAMEMAAPFMMRPTGAFNADPYKVAVRGHTLRFDVTAEEIVDPNNFDPETPVEDAPKVTIKTCQLRAVEGHSRQDLITELLPVDYNPAAACPLWLAFLDEFMPDEKKRRLLRMAAGLGLIGITVQHLFFHYGNGANGKSVFLEVLCRVLGATAVTLPSESFFGAGGNAGGATPDLARLFGKRFLRVQELPEGEDLREDLVKKLTGGEDIPVRDLFAGYFDFRPIFVGHMSGNAYPQVKGTDNGIWRRVKVVEWLVTVAEARQRNFEDVVSEFVAEAPGILNWMIAGAIDYFENGLVIPESVTIATQKMRDEMDPTAGFTASCIVADELGEVAAADLYRAYTAWCSASGASPISQTRFGKIMAKRFVRRDGAVRHYVGIRLENVPEAPAAKGDFPEGYGG